VGTVLGPVVGAFLVVAIQNYLAQVGAWVTIIQGGIFVACVLTFRRGIVGELREWWQRRFRPQPPATDEGQPADRAAPLA
jgi:branched-chain amino acid transport system permease protein